jgi:hypothetical protein
VEFNKDSGQDRTSSDAGKRKRPQEDPRPLRHSAKLRVLGGRWFAYRLPQFVIRRAASVGALFIGA